jgi:hypothetical protein
MTAELAIAQDKAPAITPFSCDQANYAAKPWTSEKFRNLTTAGPQVGTIGLKLILDCTGLDPGHYGAHEEGKETE